MFVLDSSVINNTEDAFMGLFKDEADILRGGKLLIVIKTVNTHNNNTHKYIMKKERAICEGVR